MGEPKPKSFAISKWAVWDAYRRVKANQVCLATTRPRRRSIRAAASVLRVCCTRGVQARYVDDVLMARSIGPS